MKDLYTDGSCLGNPGRGGWAAKCVGHFEVSGNEVSTTNNIMEMTAVLEALKKCLEMDILEVRLFTDSNYVKNGVTQWMPKWKVNNWKTSSGQMVKNRQLWIEIDILASRMKKVEWCWVKAHAGNIHNEWVDREARKQAQSLK